jgi:hypothetical protein
MQLNGKRKRVPNAKYQSDNSDKVKGKARTISKKQRVQKARQFESLDEWYRKEFCAASKDDLREILVEHFPLEMLKERGKVMSTCKPTVKSIKEFVFAHMKSSESSEAWTSRQLQLLLGEGVANIILRRTSKRLIAMFHFFMSMNECAPFPPVDMALVQEGMYPMLVFRSVCAGGSMSQYMRIFFDQKDKKQKPSPTPLSTSTLSSSSSSSPSSSSMSLTVTLQTQEPTPTPTPTPPLSKGKTLIQKADMIIRAMEEKRLQQLLKWKSDASKQIKELIEWKQNAEELLQKFQARDEAREQAVEKLKLDLTVSKLETHNLKVQLAENKQDYKANLTEIKEYVNEMSEGVKASMSDMHTKMDIIIKMVEQQ